MEIIFEVNFVTLSSKSTTGTFFLFSKAENLQTSKCRIFCSNKDIKSGESSDTFLNIKFSKKIYGQHMLTFGQHFAYVRNCAQCESVFFWMFQPVGLYLF